MAPFTDEPFFVEALGSPIWLDASDRALTPNIRRHGVWEPLQTQVVLQELKPGQTAVDVGANVGYYSVLFGRCVGEAGRVIAFEPEPANFALLERNVELNRLGNVALVRTAVSDVTGELDLYLSEQNKGTHRLRERGPGGRSLTVRSVRLDDYFDSEPGEVDLVKMDIEGAEAGALDGMARLLARNPGCRVLTEFSPRELTAFGTDPLEFALRLTRCGLHLYVLDEHDQRIDPVVPTDLEGFGAGGEEVFTNLFCTPEPWQWPWLDPWRTSWEERRALACEDLRAVVADGDSVVLVDDQTLGAVVPGHGRTIPFLERDGEYEGTPLDDLHAIRELERLRQAGARWVVFGWPSFWWLDFYPEFQWFLRSRFRAILENDRVIAFDLESPAAKDIRG